MIKLPFSLKKKKNRFSKVTLYEKVHLRILKSMFHLIFFQHYKMILIVPFILVYALKIRDIQSVLENLEFPDKVLDLSLKV